MGALWEVLSRQRCSINANPLQVPEKVIPERMQTQSIPLLIIKPLLHNHIQGKQFIIKVHNTWQGRFQEQIGQ